MNAPEPLRFETAMERAFAGALREALAEARSTLEPFALVYLEVEPGVSLEYLQEGGLALCKALRVAPNAYYPPRPLDLVAFAAPRFWALCQSVDQASARVPAERLRTLAEAHFGPGASRVGLWVWDWRSAHRTPESLMAQLAHAAGPALACVAPDTAPSEARLAGLLAAFR